MAPVVAPPPTRPPQQPPVDDGLERRGYRGYAQHARATYEQNRRDKLAAELRAEAVKARAQASAHGAEALRLNRAGDKAQAQQFYDAAIAWDDWAHQRSLQAEAVLAGTQAPEQVLIDNDADFQRINDDVGTLAPGAVGTGTVSALTGTDHPPSVDSTRPYGQRGGLRPPLALHQADLERAMPRDADGNVIRTADPRQGNWFGLANDGGPAMDPTRGINCLDCSLSLYETWVHGRPRVSAPRTFDGYALGDVNRPLGGEDDGPGRVEDVTGGRFQQLSPNVRHLDPAVAQQTVYQGYTALHNQLLTGGHGSYAFIVNQWEGGSAHAWVAMNQNGTILYVDPQVGVIGENDPPHKHWGVASDSNVVSIDALVLDGNGNPMPLNGYPQGTYSARPPVTGETAAPPAPPVNVGPVTADAPLNRISPGPVTTASDHGLHVNRLYLLDSPTTATTPAAPAGGPPPGDVSPATAADSASTPSGPMQSPMQDGDAAQAGELDPRAAEQQILEELRSDHRAALEGAVAEARIVADAVLQDLSGAVETIPAGPDDERPTLVDTEYRTKELSSLARKFAEQHEAVGIEPDLFLAQANDLVRFSVQTPEVGYSATLQAVLDGLSAQGYRLEDVKNFWRDGNRYNGVNVTMRTPGGHLMEVQFPTEASRLLGKRTHKLYEVVRLETATPTARVEAFLDILRLNKETAVAERMPDDLGGLPDAKDTSFEKWTRQAPHVWHAYHQSLAAEDRTFADIVDARGLTIDDFPRGERLGLGDDVGRVRLSRVVADGRGPALGADRHASVDGSVASSDLERAEAGLDVQPEDRGSLDLRRPVRGPADAGDPRGSGADRPGVARDRAAGRGGTVPDVPGRRRLPGIEEAPHDTSRDQLPADSRPAAGRTPSLSREAVSPDRREHVAPSSAIEESPGARGDDSAALPGGSGSAGDATSLARVAEAQRVLEHLARTELSEIRPLPVLGTPDLPVRRADDGLIDDVLIDGDWVPIKDYLGRVLAERVELWLEYAKDGNFPQIRRQTVQPCVSVAVDRLTGRITEGHNRLGIEETQLHPLVRARLDAYRAECVAQGVTYEWGTPYRHRSTPGRHSEVYSVSELLWVREAEGLPVDASALKELRIDNYFPWIRGGLAAPCCANCTGIIFDVPCNAGKFPGGPDGDKWEE